MANDGVTAPKQTIEPDEEMWDEESDGPRTCPNCHGEGEYVICVDDLCRGAGECIHGDGMQFCRVCAGSGEVS